jgi:hypothetical protein
VNAAAEPGGGAGTSLADDVLRPVDIRSLTLDRITSWIVTAIIVTGALAGVLIVWVTAGPPVLLIALMGLAWAALAALLSWLSQRWPRWEYDRKRYRLSRLGIEIRKGVLWRATINVPRSRIQHTDVTQGPLMRRYGLATLVIHTAGTENAAVELSGLGHETALALRDFLIAGGERDGV